SEKRAHRAYGVNYTLLPIARALQSHQRKLNDS
ncbi:hypothetical protein D047_4961B, partial [Vibrio parahaemolyticus VPTS-2010_2]